MAIIVTDSVARTSSRFAKFARAKGIGAALVVAVGLALHVPIQATEYQVGIVTEGAFLLSEEANARREGKLVHDLVGYLPIGTRVYFIDEVKTINNLTEGRPERYYLVLSSIGISGLLREDPFVQVKDKPIAIVVSNKQIALHNPDPAKGKFRTLLTVGPYDNAYLEITDMSDPEFIHAVLNRRAKTTDLPKAEGVRLWRENVRFGSVTVVNPQTFNDQNLPVPRWSKPEELDDSFVDELIQKVEDKLGNDLDQVRQFLSDASTIQCLLKASGEAELGFKLFGNGLSFNLALALKDQDHMFRLTQRKLNIRGEERIYLTLQNVKCDDGNPERLQQFTLQEGIYNPQKRTSVLLQDLGEKPSEWVTSLQGREVPFRMVRIANEQGYMRVLHQLTRLVSEGDSFIGEAPPEDREILLNLLLREISHFEHRDLIPSSGRSTNEEP